METSFERHLRFPRGRGPVPEGSVVGSAGGGRCDDLVRLALRAAEGQVEDVTFDAKGCGATVAAASACVEAVAGAPLLEAARVGREAIATELGGLSPGKMHAADLAADALHRAISNLCSSGSEPIVTDFRPGRVLVGMSGGVDSAVAALLAAEWGAEPVAVTLKLWADPATDGTQSCCSPQAVVSARELAHSMGLPHLTLDLQERFRHAVVEDFLGEHDRGRTPNPCVRCNGMVRFDAMLQLAERVGCEVLVTGHYARIGRDFDGPLLARAADSGKDQTYMLSALSPELLDRIRFPLGELTKPEVRDLARAAGLPVAEKKESQDLCFMAGTSRERFLARHGTAGRRDGDIVDQRGRALGRHRGQLHFTVGQRRGLGVAAAEPLYVLAKDATTNRVVVGPHAELAATRVVLSPAQLYRDAARVERVKLRYRSAPLPCSIETGAGPGRQDELEIRLHEPAYGVAAGQTACLMEGDLVLGSGTIARASVEGERAAMASDSVRS